MTEAAKDTTAAQGPEAAGPLLAPALLATAAIRLPPPVPGRLSTSVSLALAVLCHATLLYLLARAPDDTMAGGGGTQLEAISVTIVSATALESRDAERLQHPAPAAAQPVDADDGSPQSAPAAPGERDEQKEEREAEERKTEPPVSKLEALVEAPPEARKETSRANSAAAAAGGVAARGDAAANSSARAAAAASPGAVREYERYIVTALARSKPKGIGDRGTVKLKFAISPSGSLAFAEVVKSSGSKKLDETALEAVRRTSFPVPPPGMTVAQLTYEIPYHFR